MTDTLSLDYELFDLPTALHKAGLAGMLLHIQNLKEREVDKPIPEIEQMNAHSARVRFTKQSFKTLFDDLYEPLYETDKKGEERFFPKGRFLETMTPGGSQSPMLRLWRDMTLAVLRVKPTSLYMYKVTAQVARESITFGTVKKG
jgi:hypothetical protein